MDLGRVVFFKSKRARGYLSLVCFLGIILGFAYALLLPKVDACTIREGTSWEVTPATRTPSKRKIHCCYRHCAIMYSRLRRKIARSFVRQFLLLSLPIN